MSSSLGTEFMIRCTLLNLLCPSLVWPSDIHSFSWITKQNFFPPQRTLPYHAGKGIVCSDEVEGMPAAA